MLRVDRGPETKRETNGRSGETTGESREPSTAAAAHQTVPYADRMVVADYATRRILYAK